MPLSKHRKAHYAKKKIQRTNNGAFGNEGYSSDRKKRQRALLENL